jgi:hypothetical protein
LPEEIRRNQRVIEAYLGKGSTMDQETAEAMEQRTSETAEQ